jgi:hypothetical protein
VNFKFSSQDSFIKALVAQLEEAWNRIPEGKRAIYNDVFWICRYANELLNTTGETPSETISLKHFKACDLRQRIKGFCSTYNMQWDVAIAEIERMSKKLKSIGWHGCNDSIAHVIEMCNSFTENYIELRKQLANDEEGNTK